MALIEKIDTELKQAMVAPKRPSLRLFRFLGLLLVFGFRNRYVVVG
jgi:hypothetical protein